MSWYLELWAYSLADERPSVGPIGVIVDDPWCAVSEDLLRDLLNEAKANYDSAPEPSYPSETTDRTPINKK